MSGKTGFGVFGVLGGLEQLERRLLLDAVFDDLQAVTPYGSLIYQQTSADQFASVGETDKFTIALDVGQTVTVVAQPAESGLDLALAVKDPSSAVLGSADASGAGQAEWLQTVATTTAGTYTIESSSVAGTGGYDLSVYLNAAVEAEAYGGAANDTLAAAQGIDDSFIDLGGGVSRGGVRGALGVDGVSAEDFEAGSLDGGWTTWSSDADGEVGVVFRSGAVPDSEYVLELDRASYATAVLNEAVWRPGLYAGGGPMVLTFWWAGGTNDWSPFDGPFAGHYNADGIAISVDGVTWYPAFTPGNVVNSGMFHYGSIDVSAVADAAQIELRDDLLIKFQQYGDVGQSGALDYLRVDQVALTAKAHPVLAADDFESGSLSGEWSTYVSSEEYAYVRVDAGGPDPSEYALLTGTQGKYHAGEELSEAIWTLNLSGVAAAVLHFEVSSGGYVFPLDGDFTGHYNGDGVAVSADAANWHPVFSLDDPADWTAYDVPLTGAPYTSQFQVKFQHYDKYPYLSRWDNLSITGAAEDWYSFSAEAGETLSVGVGLSAGQGITIELYDETGVLVGLGVSGDANIRQIIQDRQAPATGRYYLRVFSTASAEYSVLVTRGTSIDVAPHSTRRDAQDITETGRVLGAVSGGMGRLFLYNQEASPDQISEIDPVTGEILSSFDSPVVNLVSLATTPTTLLAADNDHAEIYELDPDTGDGLRTLTVPDGFRAGGLAFLDGEIFVAGYGTDCGDVTVLDYDTGDVLRSLTTGPTEIYYGLAASESTLYAASLTFGSEYVLLAVDAQTGTTTPLGLFELGNSSSGRGLAVVGEEFFVPDHDADKIHVFDIDTLAARRTFDLADVYGDLGGDGGAGADHYQVWVNDGDELTIGTATPHDQTLNMLDPRVELYDSDDTLVAADDDSGPGVNALVEHTAALSEAYTVRVIAADGAGEYVLTVAGHTGQAPWFAVVSTDPSNGQVLTAAPGVYTVDFSGDVAVASLDASDLTIDGEPSTGWSLVDNDTVAFGLWALGEGPHVIEITPGAIGDLAGTGVDHFASVFTLDLALPRVIDSSVQEGDRFNHGALTVTIEFDAPIDTAGVDETDFELAGLWVGPKAAQSWSFNPGGTILTLQYADLERDRYTLRLLSGNGRFEGLDGGDLDGETPDWPIGPNVSGDGAEGGDFAVSFVLDTPTVHTPTDFQAVAPFGSMVYRMRLEGDIASAGATDVAELDLDADQTVTVAVEAESPLRPTIELRDPFGVVIGTATAAGGGRVAILQTVAADDPGTYTLTVGGAGGTTGAYTGRVLLNAAANDPGGDGSLAAAQDINASWLDLGAGASRAAVLGQIDVEQHFHDDFESGALAAAWTTYTENTGGASGRIRVTDELEVRDGSYALVMDATGGNWMGEYSLNEAIWTVDLSGLGQVYLAFARRNVGSGQGFYVEDYTGHPWANGVSISDDGVNWRVILNARGNPTGWLRHVVDLTAAAGAAGMTLGADFQIKFQQFGCGTAPGAGMAWDNIAIITAPADGDVYRFDAQADDLLHVALTPRPGTSLHLELLDGGGDLMALGQYEGEVDVERISGLVIPESGPYYLRVLPDVGNTVGSPYSLVVTRNTTLGAEPGTPWDQDAQDITPVGRVLGSVGLAPANRLFAFETRTETLVEFDPLTGEILSSKPTVQPQHGYYPGLSTTTQTTLFASRNYYNSPFNIWESGRSGSRTLSGIGYGVAVLGDEIFSYSDVTDTVAVYDYATGGLKRTLPVSVALMTSSPEGLWGFDGGSLYRIDPWTGEATLAVAGALEDVRTVAVIGDELFATHFNIATEHSHLKVYDLATLAWKRTLYANTSSGDDTVYEWYSSVGAGAGTDDPDRYAVDVRAGDSLTVTTATPGDGPLDAVNDLDPVVRLYDPTGALVASDDNGAPDGRNVRLDHLADQSGAYTIVVGSVTRDRGDYLLTVDGYTVADDGFEVAATDITDGVRLDEAPLDVTVEFSHNVLLSSLDADDVLVNGVAALDYAVVDNDTILFVLPPIGLGEFELSIPAGAILDVTGRPVAAFGLTMVVPAQPRPPAGSLVYVHRTRGLIQEPSETNDIPLQLDGGQTVSVAAQPIGGLRPTVELRDPTGVLLGSAAAGGAGQEAVLQGAEAATPGVYTLTVAGAGGTTGSYAVDVLLNAIVESESHGGADNDSLASAESLDDHFLTLAGDGQRAAVLGSLETGKSVLVVGDDFESGAFSGAWSIFEGGDNARVRVTDEYGAAEGSYALMLWNENSNIGRVLTEATWTVDLTGLEEAILTFQHGEDRDDEWLFDGDFEEHAYADGIAISDDGVQWHPIWQAVDQEPNQWETFRLDLSAAAIEAGMSLGQDFHIRFQAYGGPWRDFWRGWDDIAVVQPNVCDVYAITLEAGQVATVALTALNEYAADVELLDAWGQPLGVGATGASNFDAGIADFVAPVGGTYYLRVTGAEGTEYNLVVTRDAQFGPEPRDSASNAHDITRTGVAMGVAGYDMGRLFAHTSVGHQSEIIEIDPNTLEFLQQFTPDTGELSGLALTPATLLAGSSTDNAIYEMDPDSGEILRAIPAAGLTFSDMGFYGNEIYLDVAGGTAVLDYQTGALKRVVGTGFTVGPIGTPDGMLGVLGRNTLVLADPLTGRVKNVGEVNRAANNYSGIAIADGKLFLTYFYDELLVYDLETLTLQAWREYSSLPDLRWDSLAGDASFGQDWYTLAVHAGDVLDLRTSTPADGPREFGNVVDPVLELYDPQGTLVEVADNNAPDGRNAELTVPAALTGKYRVKVFAAGLGGEYVLEATGHTGSDTRPLTVVAVDPADGAELSEMPRRVTVTFSDGIRLDTLSPGDLKVNGQQAVETLLIDGRTVAFELPSLVDGTYGVTIDAGSILDWRGMPVDAFRSTFSTPIETLSVEPLGSLMYRQLISGTITPTGGDAIYAIELDADQTLTVIVDPAEELQATIDVRDPSGASLGTATSSGPGAVAVLQTAAVTTSGAYQVVFGGGAGSTGQFHAEIVFNAAAEAELHGGPANDDLPSAQDIDGSFTDLGEGASRGAVIGTVAPDAGDDPEDFYQFTMAAGQVATVAVKGLSHGDSRIEMLDASGTVLAAGVADRINLDGVISGFVAPADGAYYIRVTAGEIGADYSVVITRDAELDTELNNHSDTAQDISPTGTALGAVGNGLNRLYRGANRIDEIDPAGGEIRRAFDVELIEANEITGLATTGWSILRGELEQPIYEIDPTTGEIIRTLGDLDLDLYDLTFLNDEIFVNHSHHYYTARPAVTVLDYADGSLKRTFGFPADLFPVYMAASTDRLFASGGGDLGYGKIYEVDPVTFELTELFESPCSGLAIVGGELFVGISEYSRDYINVYDLATLTLQRELPATYTSYLSADHGHLHDYYSVTVNAGDTLTISTRTPAGGSNGFVNDLDPVLDLYRPDGSLVATDDNGASDERNAEITHLAEHTGRYLIKVLPAAYSQGEYVLHVGGYTPTGVEPTTAVATSPAAGDLLETRPLQLAVDFSRPVRFDTVDPSGLTLDGAAATGVSPIDGDTLVFDLPPVLAGGHSIALAAGAVTDLLGMPVQGFSATFTVGEFDFPVPLVHADPDGSFVYQGAVDGSVDPVGDTNTFTLELDAGQVITVAVEPGDGLQPTVDLFDPFGTVIGSAASAGSGRAALVQTVPVGTPGAYRFVVGSSAGTTGDFTARVVLNARVEAESTGGPDNSNRASAEDLTQAFTGLSAEADRAAVVGTIAGGYENFDTGRLGGDWATYGIVFLTDWVSGISAYSGQSLFMMYGNLCEAIWTVNPVSLADPVLSFYHYDDDRNDVFDGPFTGHYDADGIAVSADGVVWYPIWDPPPQASETWAYYSIDLADAAAPHGLSVEREIYLKFQRYDEGTGTRAWDEIVVSDSQPDEDWYHLAMDPDRPTTVALAALTDADVEIALYDAAGGLLASGSEGPDNVDRVIDHFVAPAGGTYYLRIIGARGARYSLLVTRGAAFHLEGNDDLAAAQDLTDTPAAMGHVRRNPGPIATETEPNDDGFTGPGEDIRDDFPFANDISGSFALDSGDTYEVSVGFTMTPEDRRDLFQFLAAPGDILQVSHIWQSGYYEIQLYDRDGRELARATPQFSLTYDEFEYEGEYYLCLYLWYGDGGGYTLTAELTTEQLLGRRDEDAYRQSVGVGDTLILTTSTPGDGPGEFVNALDPIVGLYDPDGVLLISDDNSASDGRNARLRYAARQDGAYAAIVSAVTGTHGEYVLHADVHDPADTEMWVVATDPVVGELIDAYPAEITVEFSHAVDEAGLDAADLTIDGIPSVGAALADPYTVAFDMPAGLVEGDWTFEIAAGAIDHVYGNTNEAYAWQCTFDAPSLVVTATDPSDGQTVNDPPTQILVDFLHPIAAATLDAADLLVDGSPAVAAALVDADTVAFDLAAGLTEGPHDVTVPAGAVGDIYGQVNEAYAGQFAYHEPPVVVASSILEGQGLPIGPLVYTARFDRALDEDVLDAADFELSSAAGAVAPDSFSYDANTYTVTLGFGDLGDADYTLRLVSGPGALRSPFGPALDGERNDGNAQGVPSGDGIVGGDFVVQFRVDLETIPLPAMRAIDPAGSLVYDASFHAIVGPAGDSDAFTIDLDDGQTLTVIVDPDSALRPSVQLLDASSTAVATATASGAGEYAVIQTAAPVAADTYTIVIAGADDTTGAYSLRAVLNAAVEDESVGGAANDGIAAAQDLDAAFTDVGFGAHRAAAAGQLSAGNVDFYQFTLDAGEQTTVVVADLSGAAGVDLALYHGEGTLLAEGAPGDESVDLAIGDFVAPAAGAYYLAVAGDAAAEYNLVVTRDAAFETDPNDVLRDAQDISTTGTVLGAVGTVACGLAELFRFQADAGDDLTITTATPLGGLDPVIELYGPDGMLLVSDDDGVGDGRNALLTHTAAAAGTYTVRVAPEGAPPAGLVGEYFLADVTLNDFPDFDLLTPAHVRVDPQVNFASTRYGFGGFDDVRDNFAVRWTGAVRIDTPGDVTFTVTCDDGGQLFIDDALAVDNGGLHGMKAVSGTVALTAGYHDLRLELFERNGDAGMILEYQLPGGARQVIPAGALAQSSSEPHTSGEYLLTVAGRSIGPAAFEVARTSPADGEFLPAAPAEMTVTFNRWADLTTLDTADLTVDGVPATAVTVVDGRTATFTLPAGLTEGARDFAIAAGAVGDVQSMPLAALAGQFTIDTVAPRIIQSSIENGVILDTGDLTYTAQFDEPIRQVDLVTRHYWLDGHPSGRIYPASIHFDADTNILTLEFVDLPEANFRLTLRSGTWLLADLAGNILDGEPDDDDPYGVPSGNGDAGGDFWVDFRTWAEVPAAAAASQPQPLGQTTGASFECLVPFGPPAFVSANTAAAGADLEEQDFTFFLEAGQVISAVAAPDDPAATLSVELVGVAAASAPAPGEHAVLQAADITADDTYVVRVTSDVPTGFTLHVFRNVLIENADTADGDELSFDPARIDLADGFYALLGTSDPIVTIDEYTLDLTAAQGHAIDVLLVGLDDADLADARIDLIAPNGTSVVTSSLADPLGAPIPGVDQAIFGAVIPEPGLYSLRVSGRTRGDYVLLVADARVFDTEPNDQPAQPLRSLDHAGGAVGFTGTAVAGAIDDADGDRYAVTRQLGWTLIVSTETPFDSASASPVNDLDPALVVYDPDGTEVAVDSNSAGDAKNAALTFTADQAGVYTLHVLPESGGGNYVLHVTEGHTGQPEITVTDSSGLPDDRRIQFITPLSQFRPGTPDSTLVRPACPDEGQYIDVTNTGGLALTVQEIQINAPDVTVTPVLTEDLVLQAGEAQRFRLAYDPTLPSLSDDTTQKFDEDAGLVIVSNADNDQTCQVALHGASTYTSDITYDGYVNLGELGVLNVNFGSRQGDQNWDPSADINGDDFINLGDLGALNAEFGRELPATTYAASGMPSQPASSTRTAAAPDPVAAGAAWSTELLLIETASGSEAAVAYYDYLALTRDHPTIEATPKSEASSVTAPAAADTQIDEPEDSDLLPAVPAEVGTTPEAGCQAAVPEVPPDPAAAVDSIAVMVDSLDYRSNLDSGLSSEVTRSASQRGRFDRRTAR